MVFLRWFCDYFRYTFGMKFTSASYVWRSLVKAYFLHTFCCLFMRGFCSSQKGRSCGLDGLGETVGVEVFGDPCFTFMRACRVVSAPAPGTPAQNYFPPPSPQLPTITPSHNTMPTPVKRPIFLINGIRLSSPQYPVRAWLSVLCEHQHFS